MTKRKSELIHERLNAAHTENEVKDALRVDEVLGEELRPLEDIQKMRLPDFFVCRNSDVVCANWN